jgi:hypothetical protein
MQRTFFYTCKIRIISKALIEAEERTERDEKTYDYSCLYVFFIFVPLQEIYCKRMNIYV